MVTGLVTMMASGVSLFVVSLPQPTVEESASVATPAPLRTPLPSTAPSTPPPTSSAKHVVEQCAQWQFPQTHLSVPSVGIEGEVTEYTPTDRAANNGKIVPPEKMSIVWDSYFCRVQNIPSYPSASAGDCIYIAGHSWSDGSAAFNPLAHLPVGTEAVLSNANGENARYRSVAVKDTDGVWKNEVEILKDTQETDTRLYPETLLPGCLKLVTCLSEGERDANGHAISLRVATFQLVRGGTTVLSPQQLALETRLANRLQ